MKTLFKSILVVSIILVASCKKDVADPTVDCSTNQNHDIEGFFNALNNQSGYFEYESMDLLSHEYTFTTNVAIQICGFGYKSQGQSLVYEIKLTSSSNSTLYSGNLSFSSSTFDYTSIPPITLQPGTYTLTRTITNNTNLGETIGPITRAGTASSPSNPTFPISLGPDISIISANFYGGGGPVPDYGIPNIYFDYIAL